MIKTQIIKGTFSSHPRGFGFVEVESPLMQDVFIPRNYTLNAVHGDLVEVEVRPGLNPEKGPEGRILSIIKRARTHVCGIIYEEGRKGTLFVFAPLLGKEKLLEVKAKENHPIGQRVILTVLDWGDKDNPAKATIESVIGHISDASGDNTATALEFEIPNDFPKDALKEAKSYGTEIDSKDKIGRKDFTKITTVTIDPETAKDFDDALSIEKLGEKTKLIVHIADVSHYVAKGSALDREAKRRLNSTYFPGTCFPMLPHELSSHLCSLMENMERLAVSVTMLFDKTGTLLEKTIERSVIKSSKRFSYESAKEVLDGTLNSPFKKELEELKELGLLLKEKRTSRGSVDLAMPDIVLQLDKEGIPIGARRIEYDITHQMVEEFMLKANEVVAETLTEMGVPSIFRVHEKPSEENWNDFLALAKALGFSLPKKPEPTDIQALLKKASQDPRGRQLMIAFIRSMKMAVYSTENIGHFGLTLKDYTHFTSPIRRYCDLIVHQLLLGAKFSAEELALFSEQASLSERKSAKAEGHVKTLKYLRYFQRLHDESKSLIFEATVSKIKPFGLFFEIESLLYEGFIPLTSFKEFFVFNEKNLQLKGTKSEIIYSIGTPIQVKLRFIDLITLEATWSATEQRRKR